METFCVIYFKDKDEKVKVEKLLEAQTKTKLIEIPDLKEYVAENFNVKISECVEMKDQATDMVEESCKNKNTVKMETIEQVIDVVPVTINNSPLNVVEPSLSDMDIETEEDQVADIVSTTSSVDQKDIVLITPAKNTEYLIRRKRIIEVITISDDEMDDKENVPPVVQVVGSCSMSERANEPSVENIVDVAPPVVQQPRQPLSPILDSQYFPISEELMSAEPVRQTVEEEGVTNEQVAPTIDSPEVYPEPFELIDMNDDSQISEKSDIKDDQPSFASDFESLGPIDSDNDIDSLEKSDIKDEQQDNFDESIIETGDVPPVNRILGFAIQPFQVVIGGVSLLIGHPFPVSGNPIEFVQKEEEDLDETMDIDSPDEDAPNKKKAPNRRKSSRIAAIPVVKKPINRKTRKVGRKATKVFCKKCKASISNSIDCKTSHAISHLNLERYECTIEGCDFKSVYRCDAWNHSKSNHPGNVSYRRIELSHEQTEELDDMVRQCFTDFKKKNDNKCQVCKQTLGKYALAFHKRQHALQHVDIMLYKCIEKGCNHEEKSAISMRCHMRRHEGVGASRTLTKIELTAAQQAKIARKTAQCFPDLK